jgi:ribonuclease Z
VVDAHYNDDNSRRIVELAEGADQLFIEAPFLQRDAAHAAARYHLTAYQAGTLARRARAQQCIPFHFSARYAGEEDSLRAEAAAAFRHA